MGLEEREGSMRSVTSSAGEVDAGGPFVALLLRNGSFALLSGTDGSTRFVRSGLVPYLCSTEFFACVASSSESAPWIGLRSPVVALDSIQVPRTAPCQESAQCDFEVALNLLTGDDAESGTSETEHVRLTISGQPWATLQLVSAATISCQSSKTVAPVTVCIDGTVTHHHGDWETEIGDVVLAAWWIASSSSTDGGSSTADITVVNVQLPPECRRRSHKAPSSTGHAFFVSAEERTAILRFQSDEARAQATSSELLEIAFASPDGDACCSDEEGSDAADESDDDDVYDPFCCPGSVVRHRCGPLVVTPPPPPSAERVVTQPTSRALTVVTSPSAGLEFGTAPVKRSTPPSLGMPYLKPTWGAVVPTRSPHAQATPLNTAATSHFFETFVIDDFLGRGAEGQVLRVRHRLTNVPYAVKAIPLKSDVHAVQVLQEVNYLARLKHTNIVSYYHSWTEEVPKAAVEQLEHMARTFGKAKGRSADDEGMVDDIDDSCTDDGSSVGSISLTCTSTTNADGAGVSQLASPMIDHASPLAITTTNTTSSDSSMAGDVVNPLAVFNANVHLLRSEDPSTVKVLFVLMDVFPTALQDLLAKRNACATRINPPAVPTSSFGSSSGSFDPSTGLVDRIANLSVMLGVLNGLQYLHDRCIVHRDVKPANIFVDPETLHTCVGDLGLAKAAHDINDDSGTGSAKSSPTAPSKEDFGLAGHHSKASVKLMAELREVLDRTLLSDRSKEVSASSPSTGNPPRAVVDSAAAAVKHGSIRAAHTIGVGSPLYAAPEQLQGTRCDALCDAFAAGLVFLEMYCIFGTAMERVATLRSAGQRGEVDPFLVAEYPELLIAQALISPQRATRLSVRQARSLVNTALLRLREREERDAEARMVDLDP